MSDEDFERRETTYHEARAVLEAQQETMSDVDTRAVRTVRITAVLVGVLLSTWRIDTALFHPTFGSLAGLAFAGSLVAGTATYSESDLYLGPSREYIEQLADGEFAERDWAEDLLYSFGVWVAENGEEIEFNNRLLLTTQTLLIIGIGFAGVAVIL